MKRIPLTEEFWINNPPDVKDSHFRDTMWIFDDVDVIPCTKIRDSVENFVLQIATMGRKHNAKQGCISMCYLTHNSTVSKNSRLKLLMNEASAYVIYPQNCSPRLLRYLLSNYGNYEMAGPGDMKKLKEHGRWLYFFRLYPQYIISQRSAEIINKNEDD